MLPELSFEAWQTLEGRTHAMFSPGNRHETSVVRSVSVWEEEEKFSVALPIPVVEVWSQDDKDSVERFHNRRELDAFIKKLQDVRDVAWPEKAPHPQTSRPSFDYGGTCYHLGEATTKGVVCVYVESGGRLKSTVFPYHHLADICFIEGENDER